MFNDINHPDPLCWTGTHDVHLLHPDPATLDLGDIARSLSRRPRFGGFSTTEVSVGQHSLLCLDIFTIMVDHLAQEMGWSIEDQVQARLAILMHDASEAYLTDIPRPLKATKQFTGYRALEAKFEAAIAVRFKFAEMIVDPHWKTIQKHVDNLALAVEVQLCYPTAAERWTGLPSVTASRLAAGEKRLLEQRDPAHVAAAFALRAKMLMEA